MMLCHILDDDELYGCLEYDLQAYLNIDLAGLWQGKFSVRKLIMWIRHLPTDSALAARGFAGDDRWGATEHLLATATDYLHLLDYHFLKANSTGKIDKPEFVTRPNMTLSI